MLKEIKIYFTAPETISITIDSSSAGTYTKAYNSGGLSFTYEINAVPSSLPLTLADTDILSVTSDGIGYLELE
jgi:hypothetical protein